MTAKSRRKAVVDLLRSSLHGRRRELISLAAWSILEAIPAFLFGLLVARAIDEGFLAGSPETGFAWLGALALSVLVGAWATRQTYLRLAAIVEPFRDELVIRTVNGSLRRSTAPGGSADTAAAARLTYHVEIVREAYASVLMALQGFAVSSVGALVGLFTLLPLFLVLVLPPVIVGLGLFAAALPGMAARQRASILADERIGEGAGTVSDGLRDVVACGGEEHVAATVGEHIDAKARATRELARFTALRTVAVALGGWIPLVLILAGGPWLIRNGASTGEILGALTYVAQGLHPALGTLVRGLGNTGLWLFVTLARIVEVSDVSEASGPAHPRRRRHATPRHHDLRFHHVTFGYGRSPEPVIRDLNLVIPDGDHLAVVGPSGVGKSTLAGLIAGMLSPQSGDVRLGNISVRDLDPRTAAQHRVLIPQEAYVFAGTLRENLGYLNADATTEQIDEAVELLGMRSLVRRMGGYWDVVDASALSAGERQLITLCRAYVSPARFVLLDEAACHLDPAAEARVELAFAARPGTLLVIAHRISSALRARRILVLDAAGTALGSHDELLVRSPLYRDLVGHWLGAPQADGVNGAAANGAPPSVRAALAHAATVAPAHIARAAKNVTDPRHQHLLLRRVERALTRRGGREH
ncbi:MAG: ABC transporter ATP-binding protein/permease [Actinobacteria bacterium]|nr:ABC transporter ATP-binding protein/permease [Actinomycetota bacterium]